MDQRVANTIENLERYIGTVDDASALPREAAGFAHALILACGARRGLEIGTSYGYSGLWIASALVQNGGTLVTIDCLQRKRDAALANFEAAGLAPHIDLRVGTALEVLDGLDGPFDFVLNDADKENCTRYVDLVAGKLSDRGVVLTDNTISHAEQLDEFVAWIRRRDDFFSTGLTLGNGMELSIKHAVCQ